MPEAVRGGLNTKREPIRQRNVLNESRTESIIGSCPSIRPVFLVKNLFEWCYRAACCASRSVNPLRKLPAEEGNRECRSVHALATDHAAANHRDQAVHADGEDRGARQSDDQ